jgi:hypothetical protein
LASTTTKYSKLYTIDSLTAERIDKLTNLATIANAVQVDVDAEFNANS